MGGFDFDEIVSHFPSPRPGDSLGASPHRWSNDSTTSIGSSIFTFPDSTTNSNRDSGVGIASSGRRSQEGYSTRSNNSAGSNNSNSTDNLLLSTSSNSSSNNTGNSFDAPLSTSSMTSFVNNLSSTTSWAQNNFQEKGGFGPKRKKNHNGTPTAGIEKDESNETV